MVRATICLASGILVVLLGLLATSPASTPATTGCCAYADSSELTTASACTIGGGAYGGDGTACACQATEETGETTEL